MPKIAIIPIILLLILLSSSLFANAATWDIQTVNLACTDLTGVFMAIDSFNQPHIVYNQFFQEGDKRTGEVIYASYNGSEWENQTVGLGFANCLALDSNNNPHILYYGLNKSVENSESWVTSTGLMYTTWTGSKWVSTQITSQVQYPASLTLDKSGNPHIVYVDKDSINYAVLTSSGWSKQAITTYESTICLISIGLGSDDKPHIIYGAYQKQGSNPWAQEIKYLILENSSWVTQTLFHDVCNFGGIAMDSHNQPHFVFLDHYLNYASCNDSVWSSEKISNMTNIWHSGCLCLDSHDFPQIDFTASDDFNKGNVITFARWTGSDWNFENIPISDACNAGSIAIDSQNNLHIAYTTFYDRENHILTCGYATTKQPLTQSTFYPTNEIFIITVVIILLIFSGIIYAILTLRKR